MPSETPAMSRDAFWKVIERAYTAAPAKAAAREKALAAEIGKLGKPELADFVRHFDTAMFEAYTWRLWGAAYIINGGCGDDAFSDFRSALISRGQKGFEQALADPDSLAAEDLEEEEWFHEGFAYVPTEAARKAFGDSLPRTKGGASAPAGTAWTDEQLEGLYPRLWKKHAG